MTVTVTPHRFYAGIGSRQTPPYVQERMEATARVLAEAGWTLRSGGAQGADTAFMTGALGVSYAGKGPTPEWYSPWPGFNPKLEALVPPVEASPNREWLHVWRRKIASELHPMWDQLHHAVQELHARNVSQVLGDIDPSWAPGPGFRPSSFVLCWTPDGAEKASEVKKITGGTGMAIRVAASHGIPVINLRRDDTEPGRALKLLLPILELYA